MGDYKVNRNKKIVLGVCICAAFLGVFSLSAIIGTSEDESTATNVEYVNDDTSEIMAHDGEILVDSLKLTKISGSGESDASTDGALDSETISQMVTSDDISELENADTYFEEVRATVNMDRNQIISMLSDVIAETESSSEKDNATKQKLKIIEYMDKENLIENLIRTKGLPECLVLMSDNAVNVTVNKQELTKSDVAKICDIIMRETGREASEIVIQSKY